MVSDPGDDATYAAGDAIRVRLTFGDEVTVDTEGGTPRLKLDLDPADGGERWAAYESGTGTNELAFAYTVVSGDASSGGVSVVADTLALDGGGVQSAAGIDAALAHEGLDPDPAHKVDGVRPAFDRASVDRATLTLTLAEHIDTSGSAPAGSAFTVTARLGPTGPPRAIAGTGTASVAGAAVTVTLAEAVDGRDTVTVAYAPPDESPLRDLAGNAAAAFSGEAAQNDTPAIAPGAPRLTLTAATVKGAKLTLAYGRAPAPALRAGGGRLHGEGERDRGEPAGEQSGLGEHHHGHPDPGRGDGRRRRGHGELQGGTRGTRSRVSSAATSPTSLRRTSRTCR